MREYELTFILQSDLDDKSREELIERFVGMIPTAEGIDKAELKLDHWGRRQLAYPINKLNDGYYLYLETELDPTGIADFERNLTYIETILRHLVVRKEG